MIMTNTEQELDEEWVELIKEAIELGISMEEVREYLKECGL